jgi:hypothetical protein
MSTVKPFDLATELIGGLLCNIVRIYFEWGCLAGFNLSFLLLHLQRDFNLVAYDALLKMGINSLKSGATTQVQKESKRGICFCLHYITVPVFRSRILSCKDPRSLSLPTK